MPIPINKMAYMFFKKIKEKIRALNNKRRENRLLRQACRMLPQGFLFSGRSQYFSKLGYEPFQTSLISEVLKEISTFINVGAHHGYYCCLALSKNINTIAFEPHPMNAAMLEKHISANKFSKDFKLIKAAVGSVEGTLELHGGGFTASLLNIHPNTPSEERQTVSVVKLESMLELGDSTTLILMDVEGYELEALKGSIQLMRSKPYWIIEVLSNHGNDTPFSEVFSFMESHNYEAWAIDEEKKHIAKFPSSLAKSIEVESRHIAYSNFLFVPQGNDLIQRLQVRKAV